MHNMVFSNKTGFACVELNRNDVFWKRLNDNKYKKLLRELKEYRCYFNETYNDKSKLSLYPDKNIYFNNLEQELEYYLKGTQILFNHICKLAK